MRLCGDIVRLLYLTQLRLEITLQHEQLITQLTAGSGGSIKRRIAGSVSN